MSLFRTKEWWSSEPDHETYDAGCLLIGNVDEKIVTGSYGGTLRILRPSSRESKIEDVLLETNVGRPILQLGFGLFNNSHPKPTLALLHPRELAVYKVTRRSSEPSEFSGGGGGSGANLELVLCYRKLLGIDEKHFSAFNMCYGSFGHLASNLMICIQGMDGQLLFYDQSHLSFSRRLNKVYIPGPMAYLPSTDSIVHCTSDMYISSYKYKSLVQYDEHAMKQELSYEWICNLGDTAVSVHCGKFSPDIPKDQNDIIVLCEHHIFCLKESGGVRSHFRLDGFPTTLTVFRPPESPFDSVLLTFSDGTLKIYNQGSVQWCASLDVIRPVQIALGKWGGIEGLICSLQEDGRVSLLYLGTEPAVSGNLMPASKSLSGEQMEEEYRKLMVIIRQKNNKDSVDTNRVNVRLQIPRAVDVAPETGVLRGLESALDINGQPVILTVNLFISYTGVESVKNVSIAINCADCFVSQPCSLFIPSLSGNASTPLVEKIHFAVKSNYTPTHLTLNLSATYMTANNEPRAVFTTDSLPLCLAAHLIAPVTKSLFKFDIYTRNNLEAIPLIHLFREMNFSEEVLQTILPASSTVLSFQYFSGDICSIIVSKNGGKYRVQSTSLQSLWVVTSEFVRRLNEYNRQQNDVDIHIAYQDALPLGDYFGIIDKHFEIRKDLQRLFEDLNDLSHQFRSIQKRLLIRYTNKNPSALSNLDTLLFNTLDKIQALAELVTEKQEELKEVSLCLASATSLFLSLLKWTYDLNSESMEVLVNHVSPSVDTRFEGKWEEETTASLIFLFRTALAKNAKENAVVNQSMELPDSTEKLKQYLKMLCDRLSKGLPVVFRADPESKRP